MKKRILCTALSLLLLLCVLPAAADGDRAGERYLEINETNFPDAYFRKALLSGEWAVSGDADTGYYMTRAQVMAVTHLDLDVGSIADYKGLEHFTELTTLSCGGYDGPTTVKNLDFSKNTKLRTIRVSAIQLKAPDFSKNIALQHLSLQDTGTEALDLSKNVNLLSVEFYGLRMKRIDLKPLSRLQGVTALWCDLAELDVSGNPELRYIQLDLAKIPSLDLSRNQKLEYIHCDESLLSELILGEQPALTDVNVSYSRLERLDVSGCPNLDELQIRGNALRELNLSGCTKLRYLSCDGNALGSLDVSGAPALVSLRCGDNALTELALDANTNLEARFVQAKGQNTVAAFTPDGDRYAVDLGTLVSDPSRVTVNDAGVTYDAAAGRVYADEPKTFVYNYDTGRGSMDVTVNPPYAGTATIEWNLDDVQYRDKTPYVLYTGAAQLPRFTVLDKAGNRIGPARYTYRFENHVNPGTATLTVTFKGSDNTLSAHFKIYLPATEATSVANEQGGVRVAWAPVEGAKGYVIYRRAWNLISSGWTTFERWNNTTETEWLDTKVYAGTRYQYGVKAYFNDPMDNYNLGVVGPLKTTVRITTRTLKSVTAGSKKMTVKWAPSKNFTGYQIKYATDANFTKNVKAIKVEDAAAASKVITGLKSGTTYYVTVRSYHVFEGMTYFGEWSNVLSCKVK